MRYLSFMAVLFWCGYGSCQLFERSERREYRDIRTSVYQVGIQRSGRVDVTLVSGARVFEHAYPMVELEDSNRPRPLNVSGEATDRRSLNTALGSGQAMYFQRGNCEWIIQTFETQPFFTVQTAFINTSRRPVSVKALYPFVVGDQRKGSVSLGRETGETVVLDNGPVEQQMATLRKLGVNTIESSWYLPAANPVSGRILIAGFLTNRTAHTSIQIGRSGKCAGDSAELFRARCVYDPPIEVPPGGRLESEVLYISVGEFDPLKGLERFGQSVGALGDVMPRRATLPHGWDSWSSRHHSSIDEKKMLAELNFVDKHLKRYGWTHFSVGDGWQNGKTDWEAAPEKFARGMKWFADEIHRRGMTAGIWADPFTVDADSRLAMENPGWLLDVNGPGHDLADANQRLLDLTVPEAYEHVVGVYRKLGRDWGFDSVAEADFAYRLLYADGYAAADLTRVEVFRLGMQATRDGFGGDPGKFIMSAPPLGPNGANADGIRIGSDSAPVWRKPSGRLPWGGVESLTNAAHRYFFTPNVWAPDQNSAFFSRPSERARWGVTGEPELTFEQSVAWLTGAALSGGIVKIGNAFTDLRPEEVDVLKRLLPVSTKPARPVDLFERANPAIWSLPIESRIGKWNILAVFNWDEAEPVTIPVPFASLGLAQGRRYTVYDFWGGTFYGTAQDRLDVSVGPGSVRLIGLRPYDGRPMFLSTDRHWSMGATDFRELRWDEAGRTLRGVFDGIEQTDYNLRLLAPPPYVFDGVDVSAGPAAVEIEADGTVLKISFRCEEPGEVVWEARFR